MVTRATLGSALFLAMLISSCNGDPAAPAGDDPRFSGVYGGQSTIVQHDCPQQANAPAGGSTLNRTLILEDRRPDLHAVFAGIAMDGTIAASGSFSATSDPIPLHRIQGQVSLQSASTVLSGSATHRAVDAQFDLLCQWSEQFSLTRHP
jgi:hypothetical protein